MVIEIAFSFAFKMIDYIYASIVTGIGLEEVVYI